MIVTTINFLWILIATFSIGFAVCSFVSRKVNINRRLDIVMVMGLMVLTVYAQFFSIFKNVGIMAGSIVLVATILIIIFMRKEYLAYIRQFISDVRMRLTDKYSGVRIMLIFLALMVCIIIAANVPNSPDDYLYHSQAIEWIETYGVVKGLGNLHMRFAYNSSFLCLQALFSWKGLMPSGQSLHGMNGFVTFLFITYCLWTVEPFKKHASKMSSVLKIATSYYAIAGSGSWSGLSTDALAMMTMAYILIKWFEYIENKNSQMLDYGILCIFSVWACTLKLSVGMIVLLTLYPLIKLIKGKQWKSILTLTCAGFVVALPFLIRNVIISGYLLYPVTAIDLFNVPWKMSKDIAIYDKDGMVIWGRYTQFNLQSMSWAEVRAIPFQQWFPNWYRVVLTFLNKLLFNFGLLGTIAFSIKLIAKVIKKHEFTNTDFTVIICIIGAVFWFLEAPLIRYGELYLWILVAVTINYIFGEKLTYGFSVMASVLCIHALFSLFSLDTSGVGLIKPGDYISYPSVPYTIETDAGNDVTIYLPSADDAPQDYYAFPTVWKKSDAEAVRMYGTTFADGFYRADE